MQINVTLKFSDNDKDADSNDDKSHEEDRAVNSRGRYFVT